jgi:hypothetical protein
MVSVSNKRYQRRRIGMAHHSSRKSTAASQLAKGEGLAYVAIDGNKPGERIGLVKFGQSGYYLAKGYDYAPNTIEQVKQAVRDLNKRLGLSEEVAQAAFFGSMFGWACPAAYPAVVYFTQPTLEDLHEEMEASRCKECRCSGGQHFEGCRSREVR